MIKLSMLIATTEMRKDLFNTLIKEFERQIKEYNLEDKVEIVFDATGKELPLGKKRQLLLNRAKGKFIVFMDDDDFPIEDYLNVIVNIIESNEDIDCIGFRIRMTTDLAKEQICDHSLKHKVEGWQTNKKGFDYIRNVSMFNPVKRELALQVGFPDLRWGEDHWFADRVTQLCNKEYYVESKPYMFWYRFSTAESAATKYGQHLDKK